MISTDLQRVQIQNIVENQLPSFVQEDFPLLGEFLKEYYVSQEYPGASADLIQNIDEYLKLESLTNNSNQTRLGSDVGYQDTTITVTFDLQNGIFGTYHFPDRYGLIQIDDEIILYKEKTNTSFIGCVRGFSGVTSYKALDVVDQLQFSESDINPHSSGTKVVNLSALLFNEFLIKIKKQVSPGFEDRTLDSNLNERLFISRSKDFYTTKGTDESFKILFGALYGEKVNVIKPREFLFKPSDAQYRITKDLVVESIQGDPLDLLNSTLYQDAAHFGDHYCIEEAYAPISDVAKVSVGNSDYYKLSLDYGYARDVPLKGSVFGEFIVHPNTQVITEVAVGSSVVDVDSTIGFPEAGELYAVYGTGVTGILTYRSKSINQFFGVGLANTTTVGINTVINSQENIRLNIEAYGYVGLGTTTKVTVRLGGVLADPIIPENTYYFDKDDTISIRSLGITTSSPKTENWFYNVATKYDIESITLVDSSDFTYTIITQAKNNFRLGDKVTITDTLGSTKDSTVTEVISDYSFSIKGQGVIAAAKYTVQRQILRGKVKTSLSDYSYIDNYFANVQNTYVKFNQDLLVASSSIPNYYNSPLDFYDRKITLNGEYNGAEFTVLDVEDHGYYTGDAVYYNSYDIETKDFFGNITKVVSKFPEMDPGVFFVKRLNKNQFQLATRPANISNNSFVSVSGIVTSNTLEYIDFHNKDVDHQLLLKEIKKPNNYDGNYDTEPGTRTGILVNGVEILNYKSNESVYYGPIKNIDIASKGTGYDVINPPILHISDNVGSGATGICAVKGSLRSIDITDTGFDYVSTPVVTINGGNGTGASASANLKSIDHSVSFNATADSARVDLTDSTIGFSTFHKFRNGEKVVYKTFGQTAVTGIVTDAIYYVHTVGVSTIKLYQSETEAINVGLTTVILSGFGVGVQEFQSFDQKKVLGNIIIDNPGSGYENKKRTIVSDTGINTSLNQININDHGYKSREIIQYSYNVDQISGINSNTNYIVTEVDKDNFKLSSVGVGTTTKFLYYDTEQYIQFSNAGLGTGIHTFNYEPIVLSLTGDIGVATATGQDFRAKLQPLFKGSIESVQVTNEGSQYGSADIINYDRQPLITLKSGSGAEITAIVNNGRIVETVVDNQGEGYNAPPNLVVSGTGYNCKLVPIIKDGKITRVRIDNPGIGYTGSVGVGVTVDDSNGKLRAKIQTWSVNLFQKYVDIISDDDGILAASENSELGIEYTHLYAPRKLRESLYVRDNDNNIKYGLLDLQKVDGEEVSASFHSPIIGWAYDGNPIYGPYGYTERTGGFIKAMESGYSVVTPANRPSLSIFPQGFFVEDFEFDNSGDLDEHNGRFCVTPDYPEGVYAYFATINPTIIQNSGPFNKYRIPEFPYLIGNSFKSEPNSFNYDKTIDQQSYDFNNNEWFRNTTPYSLTEPNTYYDFLQQPNKEKTQLIDINLVSHGTIDKVGILTGGNNYKVNDDIHFEKVGEKQQAKAKVSKVGGKVVTNISVASSTISDLEVVPFDSNGSYIAISTSPHNFTNLNLVSLSGFNTSVNYLEGNFNIGVRTESILLAGAAGTTGVTGLVTYFGVSGSLSNDLLSIRENDILGIGTETIKVLKVDKENSRLRVLRAQESTVGSAHTAGVVITEDSRKFTFNSSPENEVTFELNEEIYFEPKESLGIGTLTGVGIGTTISFSNPGAGLTQIYIQTEAIYLPNHGLQSGEIVNYKTNTGDPIGVSTDGITLYNLPTDVSLYVARISNDLIGIQTFRVGLGSTGTFVGIASTSVDRGLLRFTGIGTGVYHSFKTVKNNVVNAEVNRNTVTVATASTHGLKFNDNVAFNVQPGIGTTVTIKYNDFNRRIVFNPKSFVAGNVDISNDTIEISTHGWNTGDKVIHTAASSSGGLEDEKMYYIFRESINKVKLCLSKYESLQFEPEFVNITSASAGTLSPINPTLNSYKNYNVRFDLSDSSLAEFVGVSSYPAFDFNLYTDIEFKNRFYSTSSTNTFEVTKSGKVGVTTDAGLTLSVSNKLPETLYYKFTPINKTLISESKAGIVIDKEIKGYNQIEVKDSLYSGTYAVTGIGTTTTFEYNVLKTPERSSYSQSESILEYSTDSTTAYGAIVDIELKYKGSGYPRIAGISSINTGVGTKAILEPSSETIGKILSTEIENIGFDYSADNTVRPLANFPEILQIESLTSFEEIGISSAGKNYSIAPNLVVIDGYTGKQVKDVDLKYEIGDQKVTILQNTKGMYNTLPTLIPTANVNGIGINTITYDSTTQNVTVGLDTAFSDSSPFSVGDKVLIENVSVGVGTTGYGYNSSKYEYTLFTLTDVNIPLGGQVGVVTYSLAGLLPENAYPGNQDVLNSAGVIIPQKYFPQFDIKLMKNNFIKGEQVSSGNKLGEVENWDSTNETLKISSSDEFNVGDLIVGKTSQTQGTIDSKINFESGIEVNAGSLVKKGWQRETGFLSDNLQRLPDNVYYQNFSYSLKSKVSMDKWDDAVDKLSHPSGFLKFSDLLVESDSNEASIIANDSDLFVFIDSIGTVDINSYPSFDLVTENSLSISDTETLSNQIYFNSKVLTDYYESVGNRVLTIDDFSTSFNSEPRPEKFSVVNEFPADQRSKKFFTLVKDATFTGERQTMFVSLLQNGSKGYINQYGRVESVTDLGSFDFAISGTSGQLEFYPTKFTVNNYNVSAVSFDIIGFANTTGIGSTTLGDFVNINSTQTAVPTGTATTIVGIASTYRSSKVLVQINADNGRMEYDELNIIHDGTTVDVVEYGQITTDDDTTGGGAGLGTYTASMSTGDIIVQFTPHAGIAASVDTIRVSIADTASGSTGIGTQWIGKGDFDLAFIDSSHTVINASGSPTENLIAQYDINNTVETNDHNAAYYILSVEDVTNDRYEMSEVIVLNDSSETYITEYGNLATVAGLGTVGAAVSSTWTNLYYTPNANIDVQVRVFQMSLQIAAENDAITSVNEIDLNNAAISGGYGDYEGTEVDVVRAFNLTHDEKNIFAREFDGSDSSVVNLTKNSITIPEHFFVSGEEVTYTATGGSSPIGIATTTITGIGTTSLLPSTLYTIKVDETTLKFAKTAEDALKSVPNEIHLTSVGVGAAHTIIARNQNTKCLVAIDNAIQQPIVSTAVTTGITSSLGIADVVVKVSGITSFFGGDLIQIQEEIMKINTVGYGSTNHLLVDRQWMGTGLGIHSENSIVTKVEGDYNIVDNTINFITAPKGPDPISSTTNQPDDRDWVGITTFSTFQGRTFMRGAAVNSSNRPYATNQVFDDISEGFTGVGKTFTLKSDGSNAVGFSTNNGVILINGVFQGPTGGLSTYQDYILSEGSGITTITFTGTATSLASDPNNSNIPVGGVVASVGSTSGLGYQPLVAAGGTAIVSAAGTVSSISIGNSGSGYRVGVQTVVNVAIQTGTNVQTQLIGIGTAAITAGHITGIAITNSQVIYIPKAIYDVGYTSTTGITTITTTTAHGLLVGQEVKLAGIAFTCDYLPAVGVQSAVYDNTTGIMTVTTSGAHGLSTTGKASDVVLTGLAFTCALDDGAATHSYPRTTDPAYGGTPVTGVASVTQFTINVGISTVPTFYASGGTIQPALIAPRDINNSDSGSDPAASGSLVLTVGNTTSFTIDSGISTRAHFYSRGGTVNRQMDVIIDEPLGYTNIPLVYSSDSVTGIGTQATVDIVVGQGSSVTQFEIKNTGYGYQDDQILTVPKMGTTGIPTDPSKTFEEFQITIQDVSTDSFAGWTFGQLEVLDKIQSQFDGVKRTFTLEKDGDPVTIRAREGSNIDVESTILVFLNDILQVPGDGYTLANGSILTFASAPKGRETDGSFDGDTCKILFYKGSGDVDVTFQDILETVKKGDTLQIEGDKDLCTNSIQEDVRLVNKIAASDVVNTNAYTGVGINGNPDCKRTVTWSKQGVDKIINGQIISKSREELEALITPTTFIIQSVGVGSTVVFVESVRTFFDPSNEDQTTTKTQKISLTSQDNIVGAAATAVVSAAGTISSVVVSSGGTGYTAAPNVIIGTPVGLGTTTRASVTSTLTGDAVSAITVTSPGTGYTNTNPPEVLITVPNPSREVNDSSAYEGDFGEIVGIATTSVGVASTGIVFDMYIPTNSFLRNTSVTGTAVTISGIQTGYYFTVSNSNIGNGLTSIYQDGSVLGIGTTFVDGVYEVAAVSVAQTSAPGIALTYVARVTTSVSSWNSLTGVGISELFGNFSWGRITLGARSGVAATSFNAYTQNGFTGLSTSAVVSRVAPLKYKNYSS